MWADESLGVLRAARLCQSVFFFFSSRRRHTRSLCDWSSDVCSSDLVETDAASVGIVVDTQRVLEGLQYASHDGGGREGRFVRANVVAEVVGFARHAFIERTDVTQEAVQVLVRYWIPEDVGRVFFGENFRAGRR